jgi:3-dehydroquinate dehydratase-2
MNPKITVINGPNLNLLGSRKPKIYGSDTLDMIVAKMEDEALALGFDLEAHQSNSEGILVDIVQQSAKRSKGLIINPGAYSHTSIALRDALEAAELPTIEVHLSNIHRREAFRRHSYISEVASGVIVGLGGAGYVLAVRALATLLGEKRG